MDLMKVAPQPWLQQSWFTFWVLLPIFAAAFPCRALEPRINEFVASNKNGLADEDGAEVDWVEIYNPNPIAQDLEGWYLTDDISVPTRWQFPAISINPNGYLIVFASGKNRTVASSNLHTNFSLSASGESIALIKPDGVTVVSRFDFGPQNQDVSYGVTSLATTDETLIAANAPARALVPTNGSLGTTWTQTGFNDDAWQSGTLAVGYENSSGYETLLGLDVRPAMNGVNTTCYIRIPFTVASTTDTLGLKLRMRYDDGFAVYLNGTLLTTAGRNAPAPLTFQSASAADHPDGEAVQYEDISLNQHAGLLLPSQLNVLAIHGLNVQLSSSDFLIGPQLIQTHGTTSLGFMPTPTPGALNGSGVLGFVGDTYFSHHRGFFTAPFDVTLSCDTPGAVIRYTKNGDTPTATTGFVYTTPILIDATTTLRAAAFVTGFQPSNVDTQTYLFLDDVITQSANGSAPAGWPATSVNGQRFDYGMDPAVVNGSVASGTATPAIVKSALQAIPTVSLVTDLANLTDPTTGIYVSPQSRGEDAERPVSLEIINDPLNPDPNGFQQNAGMRIRGGFSRDPNNPKHSFRLFFRSEYGKGKMNYDLFGPASSDSFDGFDLRTSQDASWAYLGSTENTFLRDETSRATQLAIAPASRVRYLHVYINGQYWGLYNTDERPNKGYGAQYFGGNEADYDVLKSSGYPGGHTTEASDGTMEIGSAWNLLWEGTRSVHTGPVADANTNYFKLQGLASDGKTPTTDPVLLDSVNLADYLLVLFYMGGDDGPVSDYVGASNNWFGLRNRTGNKGFRFFIHDFEQSLGLETGTNQRVGKDTLLRPWSNTVPGLNDYTRSNPEFMHEDLAWSLEYRTLFGDRAHKHFFNNGAMTNANVHARMNSLATMIDTAIWGESARWGDSVQTFPFVRNDWLAANQRLFNFITFGTTSNSGTGRVNEIIRQLRGYDGGTKPLYPALNAPVFSQHGGGIPAVGTSITMTQSNAGTNVIYYRLDGKDPRAVGGAIALGSLTYAGPVAVTGWTTTVRARVINGTNWSALNEAVFVRSTGPPPLRIVEIMSAPSPPNFLETEAGFIDKDEFEFVEILNTGTESLNLRDVRLFRGVEITFGDVTLAAGERGVVVHRLAAFRQRYGNGPRVLGEFEGSLNDGGNRLALTSALGAVISDFTYDAADPWPQGLPGSSLVLRSPPLDPALPASWRSSVSINGTPGGGDSTTYAAWKTSTGVTSESVDIDRDGLLPLLEYASGGSPTTNDAGHNPTVVSTLVPGPPPANYVLLSYLRRRGADDLQATLEQSTNLTSWTPAPAELISVVAQDDGTEIVTLRTLPVATSGQQAFLHVRWQVPP